jgi:hypothetical protein
MATEEKAKRIYPTLLIEPNKKLDRRFAFPFIGIIIKFILLIPVFIEGIFIGIAFIILWILNSFYILFTGKYWKAAYEYFVGMMRFSTKIYAFILGLTDTYPGFTFASNGAFDLKIDYPRHPNRWFAFPILGLAVRFIVLIPFTIFARILQNGSTLAMIGTWFTVTFQNKFPQSLYEFEHDTIRVHLAEMSYMTGLSDTYPSFAISMKHQGVKIFLLIAGTIMLLFTNWRGQTSHRTSPRYRNNYQNQYNQMQHYNYPPQRPMNPDSSGS